MTTARDFPALETAINADAWEYLLNNAPEYAAAVQKAVTSGGKPDEIYRFVLDRVGLWREPLAMRCKQAAGWLMNGEGES
jgi:hypothetical protein